MIESPGIKGISPFPLGIVNYGHERIVTSVPLLATSLWLYGRTAFLAA
jgi:hypothetical protein